MDELESSQRRLATRSLTPRDAVVWPSPADALDHRPQRVSGARGRRRSHLARCSSADRARPGSVRRNAVSHLNPAGVRSVSPAQRLGGGPRGRAGSGSDSVQAEHRQVPYHRFVAVALEPVQAGKHPQDHAAVDRVGIAEGLARGASLGLVQVAPLDLPLARPARGRVGRGRSAATGRGPARGSW